MSYKTPMGRVIGLGSAKDGVEHWWAQRLTSIALIPLTILFVFPLADAIGDDHAEVIALYQSPWHAIIAILMIIVTFRHISQGLQVVIEDYVHGSGMRTSLLVANNLFCGLLALAGVFSVAKIAFGA